jgi:hypothetical protein
VDETLEGVSTIPTEEIIAPEQPETVVEAASPELAAIEEGTPSIEEASAVTEIISAEQVPTETGELKVEEAEKPVDFNEIFTLRPEILGIQNTEEEEEEDLDKKGKKKKKKKKFVEVVYDPDRDITLVKRKRTRGGDWEDDWNF